MPLDYSPLFSKAASNVKYSPIRKMAKMSQEPGVISFAAGAPSADTFPVEAIRRVTDHILGNDAQAALQYGLTLGYPGLIEVVVEISRMRRIQSVSTGQVAITSGSQQALDLVGRLFLDPGDVVLVELPSYIGALAAFRNHQAELVGVRQDNTGIDLEYLQATIRQLTRSGRRIKLIYVIPNFQNPSGITLSLEKRKALVELACSHKLLIVEDDPYGELFFDHKLANQLLPVKAFDEEGVVLYLSTFSKILSPGLRAGWMIAPERVIEQIDMVKQAADLCGSMLDQRIVAECWRKGVIQGHLPLIRKFYRKKCQVMLSSLKTSMPQGVHWMVPAGGLFVWLTLPDSLDSEKLLRVAFDEEKVIFVIGSPFYVNGEGQHTLRLAFSKENEDNIRTGVLKLSNVFKAHLE
jgi:2-aminoadipate transaminase